MLTELQEKTIKTIVNIFETGKINGDYGSTEVLRDGAGITYGKSCTTLNSGNLYKLLKDYIEDTKPYAINEFSTARDLIKMHLEAFKNKERWLNEDKYILASLKELGNDPNMITAQNRFFDEVYFVPAIIRAEELGLTLPISYAIVYDSYVHGGFDTVRKLFPNVPPSRNGDEIKWITAYVNARYKWLKHHPKKILNNTTYRMQFFIDCLTNINLDLDLPLKVRDEIITEDNI